MKSGKQRPSAQSPLTAAKVFSHRVVQKQRFVEYELRFQWAVDCGCVYVVWRRYSAFVKFREQLCKFGRGYPAIESSHLLPGSLVMRSEHFLARRQANINRFLRVVVNRCRRIEVLQASRGVNAA